MAADSRVDDLLAAWRAAYMAGDDTPTAELCRDCPELLPEVEKRITASRPELTPQLTHGNNATLNHVPSILPDRVATAGEVIAGRYTLVSRIGEGGMGEVWVALQSEPVKRNVALKLIRPGMDSRTVLKRFEQERQALALMDHPHIAKVLDGGTTDTLRPFFVMELVDGLPLTRFCDDNRLGIAARLELLASVCRAVQHAHQKGIVHRDLKPSNILVTVVDGTPTPKVIDFGVAKAISGNLIDESMPTMHGAIVGTLEYMSPEQAGCGEIDIDTRTDIYSLGVILYELLTGLRPVTTEKIRGALFDQVIRMIHDEEPAKPSVRILSDPSAKAAATLRQTDPVKLAKLLRGELDWIALKCLEKQRDRRYATASDLARDIQRYLDHDPVEARPPSVRYRFRKFLQRNSRAVAGATVMILAVVVGSVGAILGMIEAEKARSQADLDRQALALKEQAAAVKEQAAAQITDYLVRTFESADPLGLEVIGFAEAGDRIPDSTARRMLDRGAEIVREHLHDQPLVRARLLDAMGNSYRSLGAWDSAREKITEALDIRRRFLGDNHPDTLVSLQSLAHLTRERGDYTEADRLYREVIARRERIYTADHLLTAETKFYLAWMTMHRPLSNDGPQFDTALVAESERLLLEVLKIREAQLPANHRDIGYTLAALAGAKLCQPNQEFYALGYATRAADVFRKSEQNTQFGSAILEILESNRHRNARRFDLAEAGYLKVLNLTRRHLGNRHPLILLQLGNLAGMYRSMGDFPKAEVIVKESLEIVRTLPLFRTQPICVDFILQYGDEVRNRRSPAEARAVYAEALRYARERPQGNEKHIATLEQRLAELPP